jgi:hypothetical protein
LAWSGIGLTVGFFTGTLKLYNEVLNAEVVSQRMRRCCLQFCVTLSTTLDKTTTRERSETCRSSKTTTTTTATTEKSMTKHQNA